MSASSVLFTTYQQAFLHKGGGEYELLETAFNLRQLGLVADLYSPFSCDIDTYDTIVHFSLVPDSLPFVERLKEMGKRIILWPNFWQCSPLTLSQKELFANFFSACDAVVFKSVAEERLLRFLIPDGRTVLRVPAGVDPCYATPTPPRLFRDSYGLEEFFLWIGIFEPAKNQLALITALADFPIPVVFVGNARDAEYLRICREAAPAHYLFLPAMPHKSDMLRAALRECRLYVELADEPGGKSVLEAVISGASVAIPHSDWAMEHFGDFPLYVDAHDSMSIKKAALTAMEQSRAVEVARETASRHLLPDALKPLADFIRQGGK